MQKLASDWPEPCHGSGLSTTTSVRGRRWLQQTLALSDETAAEQRRCMGRAYRRSLRGSMAGG